jgi:tetratricopeptide (TPR) repeat protein
MTIQRAHPILLLAVAALTTSPAVAQQALPSAAATAPATTGARARELFRQGNALYEADKPAEAEALYREAWALQKTWDIACNLGVVELDLGKHRDAAEHLAFALREYPAGEKAAGRTQLEERLAAAKAQVATLRIRVNVDGAEVLIDGKTAGTSPLPPDVFILPGSVAVRARATGHDATEARVEVRKGETKEVTLRLAPTPRSLIPAYVLGGVALAAAGTGAGLLIASQGKRSDAESQRDQIIATFGTGECNGPSPSAAAVVACDRLVATLRDRDTFGNAGVATLAGAGIAGAGAVVYWLVAKRSAAQTAVTLWPAVGANSGGVLLQGAF